MFGSNATSAGQGRSGAVVLVITKCGSFSEILNDRYIIVFVLALIKDHNWNILVLLLNLCIIVPHGSRGNIRFCLRT